VQFATEMKEDEILVGRLRVLKVILVMLKRNKALTEALKDTSDTLGPLGSIVDGERGLIECSLVAE
jgi:hypothetical protein